MSDESRRPPEDEPGETADRRDGDDPPPPATWAGRERAGAGAGGGEEGGQDAPGGDDAGRGLTEEFDQVERELGESLEGDDDANAGEGEEGEGDVKGEPSEDEAPAGEGGDGTPSGDETIEADTLALSDREEAEEAALAGLRARAARGSSGAGAGPVTAEAAEAAADVATAESDAVEEEDEEASEPVPVPAAAGEEKPPKRRGLWPRFLAASVLIVASVTAATAVSLLLELTELARAIDPIPNVAQDLDPAEGGDPQTILILGSDERLGVESHLGSRSDTTIVLRVDPDRGAIALLSIPRDLKVDFDELGVDGLGTDRFNAAYSEGGPRATLKAVKNLLGIDVNHVVNINFTGFADAVNAIDCVYMDVDQRYYVAEGSGYAAIDPPIEAGYQRLCGLKALQYVRFRHDDNDLVRAARQQDFLREARAKVTTSRLIDDRQELIDIFTEYTSSDDGLRDPIQLIELLKTFMSARSAPVNEVHFPAQLGGANQPYVTATEPAIEDAVDQLMGTQGTPGPKPGSSAGERRQERQGGGNRERGGGGGEGRQSGPDPDPGAASMIDAEGLADVARLLADQRSPSGKRVILDFPVFYPGKVPDDTSFEATGEARAFPIDGPDDEVYEGYKIVLGTPGSSGLTEYWGISGTNWSDPPILENPSETREIDGREYLLFFDGDRLRLVGWKQGQRSYWVNNTLLQTLDEDEMLATAQSMRSLDG